ncbi:SDR family oxidoreductase [Alicyclobacillus sp.]|uniref:SDR family NAD(P)-dependent oxidoreductase n=1 Tax=Alicyclobacillus sp. TaxID=61169 RepID=UPI0025B9313D|nr:SDR family oxidoreductase [Alicyclobacillus sp.]MCL6515451.1 SDR family oxidoreductase [Alicyclobacillus sp.]
MTDRTTETSWEVERAFGLAGRRAIVTGASRGIGRTVAIGLARAGADVALVGRDEAALAETADLVRQARPSAAVSVHRCDVRDTASVRRCVAAVEDEGPVDVLVNNAGLNIRKKALETSEADWQTVVDTDLKGAFFMAQEVGRGMVARGRGSIINVSSVGGHVALRTGVAYAAAKAGVIQMTKVLALEWGPHGVRVNGIAPWYFRTPLTDPLLADPAYLRDVLDRTPLGRVGEVTELIGPVVFLASDASSYVNGHTLFVDGGMSVYGF